MVIVVLFYILALAFSFPSWSENCVSDLRVFFHETDYSAIQRHVEVSYFDKDGIQHFFNGGVGRGRHYTKSKTPGEFKPLGGDIVFTVRMNETEHKDFVRLIQDTRSTHCSEAACDALRKSTGMYLPKAATIFPRNAAWNMLFHRIFNPGRVTNVKIYGGYWSYFLWRELAPPALIWKGLTGGATYLLWVTLSKKNITYEETKSKPIDAQKVRFFTPEGNQLPEKEFKLYLDLGEQKSVKDKKTAK